MKNKFRSTGPLLGLIARRERLDSTLWVLLLSAFSILLAPMLARMFDSPARQALILTIDNPALISMLGPIYGRDNYTAGAMYFNMMVQWVMLTAAVMNILLVVRHTRADEERSRSDMLLALPTGRFAPLAAVLAFAFFVDLVIALLSGIGIGLCRVEDMGWNGAMLYGAALGAVGLVFAALAALFAQLCTTSRGAVGLSILALGALYVLRGVGDVGSEVLALLSPLGLAQRTQAFVKNFWLPIPILLLEAAAIAAGAFALNGRRDIRQGFISQRPGRDHASPLLRSPLGLAFRLVRMPFFGWLFGMFLLGASYGSILGTIDTFVESSEFYSMVIGARPGYSTAQMFVAMVTSILALCTVIPVLTVLLKVRGEEKDGRSQPVLAAPVSKSRYFASFLIIAAAAALLMELAAALGIYAAAIAVLPDPSELPLGHLLLSNLVYVPALLVMLGIGALFIGAAPQLTALVWIYFGFSFFASFMGRIPGMIPEWLRKLTPFAHIPVLPVDELNAAPLIALTLLAAALMGLGTFFYRRRDLE